MATTQSIRQHALPGHHPRFEQAGNFVRRHWLASSFLVVILVIAFLTLQYGNEVLRKRVEGSINANLKGYTVSLPDLAFHPLGFSMTLKDLELRQQRYPQPPIAFIPRIDASVAWRDLLHARLVADFVIDRPDFHINLKQLTAEAKEPTKVQDKGWQEAVESIYPLKINHFQIKDGKLTYIDRDAKQPLKLTDVDLDLKNIRNVRSPEEPFPSDVRMSATVFGKGGVELVGKANFLTEPYASADVDLDLRQVPLNDIKPIATHANMRINKGVLDANGHALITPEKQDIHLKEVTIRGLALEYFQNKRTEVAEAKRIEAVKETAADISNEPKTLVRLDALNVVDARIGYANEAIKPGYRIHFADTDIELRGLSNQATKEPAKVSLAGKFMGQGATKITTTFRPMNKVPEFDVAIQIQPVDLKALNDILRSYGNFDVAEGRFSFYSELSAHDGAMRGYVKPLFTDMKVYEKTQDKDESTMHKLYERAIGGVAKLLENRGDDVATKAEVIGRVDNPNVRTWQVVLSLLRNAFIQAITPGLEDVRPGLESEKKG